MSSEAKLFNKEKILEYYKTILFQKLPSSEAKLFNTEKELKYYKAAFYFRN